MFTTLIVLLSAFAPACAPNEGVLHAGRETPGRANTDSEKTPFAKDLEAMRTAGFTFIYVLRRKDGGVINADDISVIKQQTVDTNRRVKSDEGEAVIIGSNYAIPPNNLSVLYSRFAVEDYSGPIAGQPDSNANSTK